MCWFFSIAASTTFLLALAAPATAQDWRTSGEDPCACTDSMPFILGTRPSVETPDQIALQVRDSADPSCRVSRLAVETPAGSLGRLGNPTARAPLTQLLHDPEKHVREAASEALKRLR